MASFSALRTQLFTFGASVTLISCHFDCCSFQQHLIQPAASTFWTNKTIFITFFSWQSEISHVCAWMRKRNKIVLEYFMHTKCHQVLIATTWNMCHILTIYAKLLRQTLHYKMLATIWNEKKWKMKWWCKTKANAFIEIHSTPKNIFLDQWNA